MGRKNSAVMPIFGWKDTKNLDFQRRSFNSTRCFCVILPAFCGFLVSGELLQLDAFRASCRNPSKRIATRYARNHSKFCSSSWSAVPEEKSFVWEDHFFDFTKPICLRPENEIAAFSTAKIGNMQTELETFPHMNPQLSCEATWIKGGLRSTHRLANSF